MESHAATNVTHSYELRSCPICRSLSSTLLYRQSFQALERTGLLEGYDIVVCSSCGMAYSDGIPSQAEFDAYYRDFSKYEYPHRVGKESEDDDWRLRGVARVLQNVIPTRDAHILEVGCASGRLLALLRDAGYSDVRGLDPSPSCAEAAWRLYRVKVLTYTIFDLPSPERRFDMLILLGVLEHVRDLDVMVNRLRELLSENGRVYVEVPDAVHLLARPDAPFQEFSTEHINYFSVRSLSNLMEAGGFRTVESDYVLRDYQRGGIAAPVVYGIFEAVQNRRTIFERDLETERGLSEYVRGCREMDAFLRTRIEAAVGGRKIIVWGVGTHTRRLLAARMLKADNIVAFVDSNPKYQGQTLCGIPVISPEALKGHNEPVLVSSYMFQDEIEHQIRQELRQPNEVLLLYTE